METSVIDTGRADSFVGKLFPVEQSFPAETRDWKFGFLRGMYPYALVAIDLLLITAIFSSMIFLREGYFEVVLVSKKVLRAENLAEGDAVMVQLELL